MSTPVHDTAAMIAAMAPALREGVFVFTCDSDPKLDAVCLKHAIGMFAEPEGRSFILPLEVARDLGLDTSPPMRCVTLHVHSALDGIGLTAAVSAALAARGIACNMVAAFHHDHVFVPEGLADDALTTLKALQQGVEPAGADRNAGPGHRI